LAVQPSLLSVDDILALPSPEADFRVAYGTDPLQFGDLRLPSGEGPHPVVVIVHGGCWRAEYDLGHIGSFAAALTREGFATWTIEYRRVGNEGGGWPGTFLDVASGTDHVRRLAQDHPLDTSRVAAVGHSAGGQLVLWLAARQKLPQSSEVRGLDPLSLRGVVSLAGVDDLARALDEGVCGDQVAKLLGGGPDDVAERYAQASPIALLPLGTRAHLVNGALDPIVPVDFGRHFAEAAERAGEDVDLTVIDDAGHFELIAPASRAWDTVRDAVKSLTHGEPHRE
jgi:acetyl esterase/lipase